MPDSIVADSNRGGASRGFHPPLPPVFNEPPGEASKSGHTVYSVSVRAADHVKLTTPRPVSLTAGSAPRWPDARWLSSRGTHGGWGITLPGHPFPVGDCDPSFPFSFHRTLPGTPLGGPCDPLLQTQRPVTCSAPHSSRGQTQVV